MNILPLRVPPWNTTLMGVVRGIADFYGVDCSDAMLYGATGHAFLIHIHPTLCQSGPYTWRREGFFRLLHNLGVTFEPLGYFDGRSSPAGRAEIEARLKEEISENRPGVLVNNEWQALYGYDESGFLTTQPWKPHLDHPPGRLTFGAWPELGKEPHVDFYAALRTPRASLRQTVALALLFAAETAHHPEKHAAPGCAMGLAAYDVWRAAIPQHGQSHGNWWNATVWSECRFRAGQFLHEVGEVLGEPLAAELGDEYALIARTLNLVADRNATNEKKVDALDRCRELERHAEAKLCRLASGLVLYA